MNTQIIVCLILMIFIIVGYFYLKKDNFNLVHFTDKSKMLFNNNKKFHDFVNELGVDAVGYNKLSNLYVNGELTKYNVEKILNVF